MLARRAAVDLGDGHALLAVLVPVLARHASMASRAAASRAAVSSRGSSSRSYSTTATVASTAGLPPRHSAPQRARSDGSQWRFCDLAREHAVARGTAAYEGPVASTSAVTLDSPAPQLASSPPPEPSPAVVTRSRPARARPSLPPTAAPLPLLKSLRSAQAASPNLSPTSLVSSRRPILYDDDGDSQHPPTPPPLVAYNPEPRRPNPHMLSAALLQAIFLGASALGLLMRRKVRNDGKGARGDDAEGDLLDDAALQSRWAKEELDKRRQEGEYVVSDVPALNLLLSTYAEVDPSSLADWDDSMTAAHRTNAARALRMRRDLQLRHVSSLLARFDGVSTKPDHWTVLAVLAFAHPNRSTAASKKSAASAFAQAQPILTQWAWEAFAQIDHGATSAAEGHRTIASTFLDYLDSALSSKLSPSTRAEMRSRLSGPDSSPPSTSSPPSLLLQLGLLALPARQTDILVSLLSDSALPAAERSSLALATLETIALDEDWRQNRDVVAFVAQSLASATAELCGAGGEGLDLALVERACHLLIHDFGVDVPLEPIYSSIILSVLSVHSESADNLDFLPSLLTSLSDARHPSLAMRVLHAIPRHQRQAEHYYAVLRSHHRPVSNAVWAELQERWAAGEVAVEVEAWEGRLTGLLRAAKGGGAGVGGARKLSTAEVNLQRARKVLKTAHADLRLLEAHGLRRSQKVWNKLLSLSSMASSEPAWRSHVGKQWRDVDAEEAGGDGGRLARGSAMGDKVDEATQAILLGRKLESHSGQRGKRQMRTVRDELVKLDGTMQRRRGGGRDRQPSSEIDILPNIVLKNLTRWDREVPTPTLLNLAFQNLGVDLLADIPLPSRHQPPTAEQFDKVRRPAYRTLLKALRNRGEHHYRRRLMRRMQEEQRAVWRQAQGLTTGEEDGE